MNHQQFTKFAKISSRQTFLLYSTSYLYYTYSATSSIIIVSSYETLSFFEVPKALPASVAAGLAKQFDTISGHAVKCDK